MKRLLLSIAVVILPCAIALGQAAPSDNTSTIGGQPPNNVVRDPKYTISMYEKADVTLTDDQKTAIAQIVNDHWKASDEFYAKNRESIMKIREEYIKTMEGHDQQAQDEARERFSAASAPATELNQKFADKLAKVITPEQKAKLKDYHLTEMIKQYALPNVLTEQQIKAVKAVIKQDDDATGANLFTVVMKTIDEVLTPQQRANKTKYVAMNIIKDKYYPRVKFTDDQKNQIETFCLQVARDETLSVREVAAKVGEKIVTMLTPEQKQALEASRKPVTTTLPATPGK